ncbi:MAG TPA: LysR family transcriptional regulator [Mogibacterium sp.]|nr:LysR family transcriptional regulator [Mogibacterium sp.]
METRNLSAFLRVAELGSFTAAANELGYSQGSITVQIQQLEDELGTKLFDRMGKLTTLTSDGQAFIPYARSALQAIQEAENFAQDPHEMRGVLRFSSSSSLATNVLPGIIADFNREYPHIQIIMRLSDYMEEMTSRMKQNEVDIVCHLDTRNFFTDAITFYEKKEPVVAVANKDYPLIGKKRVKLRDLLYEPLLVTERAIGHTNYLEKVINDMGEVLQPTIEVSSSVALREILINSNRSASIMPYLVVKEAVEAGKLVLLDVDDLDIPMWSQFVYHKNKWVSPIMKAFIDFVS